MCLSNITFRGGSPTAQAKKRTGVLVMGDAENIDEERVVATLRKKVRTIEYRKEGSLSSLYTQYWLGVMDGRFKPGHDLSFEWVLDEKSARERMTKSGRGGFIYFYAEADKNAHVQNVVLMDEKLRAVGSKLTAVKLDRNKHEELFKTLGLKTTPAVAVVDQSFALKKAFETKIKATAIVKALKKVG